MSCQPCGIKNWIPRSQIYAILNDLSGRLCSPNRPKQIKYEDFVCAIRRLSGYSIDPSSAYVAFIGARNSDPSKFAAVYIDNLRGEFDPNTGNHATYHVAFVLYGDTNGVCRSLRQRGAVIAGNSDAFTGESLVEQTVARKAYRGYNNNTPDGTVLVPGGLNNPAPWGGPVPIPGTPADINFGNVFAVGPF